MAAAAPTASPNGPRTRTQSIGDTRPLLDDHELSEWRKRITQARADRRRFEPGWRMNLAFAAGKQWLEWKPFQGSGRFILPKKKPGEHRYTVDKITDLRLSMLGQFSVDDDRPQLLFRSEDLPTEDFAETANDAIAAGWDTEWLGDEVLEDVKRTIIDLGTAAVRCRFDPTAGPTRAKQVPHRDGKPVLRPAEARSYVADQETRGQSADLRSIHEGRIRWDHGTPFNLLVPSGIKREAKFPWECWVEPVHVDKIVEQWPNAKGIQPESIDDINGLGDGESNTASSSDIDGDPGIGVRLQDHAFVYTVYERPCPDYPNGRVIVFAGANLRPLEVREQLDYVGPDGERRSGIHYFHYVRLTDRFWSRSIVDLVREGQRAYNKRRSQIGETIDRGQPFIIHEEGKKPKRVGFPVELIGLPKGAAPPVVSSGVPVGDWMFKELDQIATDLRDTSGLQDVLQGENPQNVGNYSQLALLQEQAGRKFDAIMKAFKTQSGHLVEDSVHAIRDYWGPDKLLALEGPDGTLKAFNFDATKIPDFYRVYVARGAAKPRSQAAELKKIDDLATYSINSGQPLPIDWVAQSYDEGKPVELPEVQRHDQLDKALLENQSLLNGQPVQVAYYDDHAMHVQVHRSLQARADATGDTRLSAGCEQHIQAHLAAAQAAAEAQQQGITPGPQTVPGAADQAGQIPHPNAFSLFLRNGANGPGNFGI